MIEYRSYSIDEAVVFSSPREEWGVFANFAGIHVQLPRTSARTAEHVYQSLKFTHPGVQAKVLHAPDARLAKDLAQSVDIRHSHVEWNQRLRYRAMRWTLRMKTLSHWKAITDALKETGDQPIVEMSRQDDHWGAQLEGSVLRGQNVLGRLWMEVREEIRNGNFTQSSEPDLGAQLTFHPAAPSTTAAKCIFAGSRTLGMPATLQALAACPWTAEIETVLSGGAAGPDTHGAAWAVDNNKRLLSFPARWDTEGKSAGFRRNTRMVAYADALIAIWDGKSKGTAHVIDTAQKAGLKVFVHTVE